MRKKILEALSTRFEGVDVKILERMAKKLAKTVKDEDGIEEAVKGVTIQQLIDSEGDRRANESRETYEQKYGLKDGKPVGATEDEDGDEDDEEDEDEDDEPIQPAATTQKSGKGKQGKKMSQTDKMLKQLLENQQRLTDELSSMKQERIGKSRKARFEALLTEADEKTKTRYMRNFDRLNFKDDEDFDTWLDDIQSDIDDDIKTAKAAGTVTTVPKGGKATRKEGEVDPSVTAYLDSEASREDGNQFSTISGLPQQTPPTPAAK